MAAITIKNMDVTYNKGKSYVIKDMNLEIKDGEFCVFLGPSGCGKSTAMYCIAGLLHPVHGEICFGNEAMNQLDERGKEKKFVPPQERNIAMVFQEYALYPNMTVRKNMSFALETKKAPKEEIEKRVNSMSAMLGLDELLDRKPAQLSGGQRQRVGIARALIMNPKLIIADECISALDVSIQAQVVNLMKDIQEETQCAYLFIAHDLSMVKYISDRIGVLHLGYMVESGTKEEIFFHPVHPYTKSLLSAIPHPNPVVEKHRVALTYNYATSGIDYAKGTEHSVGGTHTVLATDEEFDAWTK